MGMHGKHRNKTGGADDAFPGQCSWTTGSSQCRIRATWWPSRAAGLCGFHLMCSVERASGRERREFAEWLEGVRIYERQWPSNSQHWSAFTEEDFWHAVLGERDLPKRTRPESSPGVRSQELNAFVWRRDGGKTGGPTDALIWRILDGDLRGKVDEARRLLAEKADQIRARYEETVFE